MLYNIPCELDYTTLINILYVPQISHCSVYYKICCHYKCPKLLYTKVTDKMAYVNSADPDQTAPEV